jgi:hypothetical protein
MGIRNEYRPKEIVLEYETYKKLLDDLEAWEKRFQLAIDGDSHVIMKAEGASRQIGTIFTLIPKKEFEEKYAHRFHPTTP